MTLCSRACAGLCSSGPPRHTARSDRPPDSTSRLAHCWANRSGWRCTKVARQPTASRSRDVAPASAESNATASSRGLASRLSPTHSVSNAPEASACWDSSIRSRAGIAPSTTARLARMSPKDARGIDALPASHYGCREGTSRPERRWCPQSAPARRGRLAHPAPEQALGPLQLGSSTRTETPSAAVDVEEEHPQARADALGAHPLRGEGARDRPRVALEESPGRVGRDRLDHANAARVG